ncbi:MAG: EAL domain-containing protein [Hyphomicrobiales bacterium]|nr:MAG: EAL domain-containing protein [Hyphomicrobiales bacterium]
MSIRFKILLACLSLTLITILVGVFAQRSQSELGTIATRIYDEAFMAVSYLREAQNGLTKLNIAIDRSALEPGDAEGVDLKTLVSAAVPDILGSLQVAEDRAMSPEGAAATAALRQSVQRLQQSAETDAAAPLLSQLVDIQKDFDVAVEIFAGDGYHYRTSVGQNIDQSYQRMLAAVIASVAVAFLITMLLSRSIVPAVHQVVRLAKSIASGKLTNVVASTDRSEMGEMLGALSMMQDSIRSNLAQIKALMAEQATNHAGEMAVEHNRLEAALNNMTQGLCLFDEAGSLTIHNRRFAEMFGPPPAGTTMQTVLAVGGSHPEVDILATPSLLRDLPDGRIIAIAHGRIESGGWVATYEDVTERRKIEARFAYLARHDALTGLPNRVHFREYMEESLDRSHAKPLVLLSLDLDGFKAINDNLGHPAGDALLQQVARRLEASADDADIVARLGGDEFAIAVEQSDHLQLAALAERVVESLNKPFDVDGHAIVISVSVGIASTADLAAVVRQDMPDSLLKNADLALYRAKADGRGTYRFFEAEMDARLQARRRLELDLRTALANREFELAFQPLVDTRGGGARVSGFEALLRWHHPARGLVSPAEFIPVAEEIGVIKDIGAWVLEAACKEAATWPNEIKVAVNLSPVQFASNTLVDLVAHALDASGLAPSRLELEITESLLLQDNAGVLATLHRLRHLGAQIAMDDFGTGYSSLSYLQRFPFDKIKIDQAFIRQLSETSDSKAIVRAVIGLGRSLGISILAEGVETLEQLTILQQEGCHDVQGYLFSRPRPADEVLELIRSIYADPPARPLTSSAA